MGRRTGILRVMPSAARLCLGAPPARRWRGCGTLRRSSPTSRGRHQRGSPAVLFFLLLLQVLFCFGGLQQLPDHGPGCPRGLHDGRTTPFPFGHEDPGVDCGGVGSPAANRTDGRGRRRRLRVAHDRCRSAPLITCYKKPPSKTAPPATPSIKSAPNSEREGAHHLCSLL